MVDPGVRETYLAKHPLEARTANTITDPDDLTREFERIRSNGYALDNEEFHEGLQCLAVPVEGLGGRFVLGISVPKQRFDANFGRYLAALQNVAKINS